MASKSIFSADFPKTLANRPPVLSQQHEALSVPVAAETVLQASRCGFALIDTSGRLVWCNNAFARRSAEHGVVPQELIAKRLAEAGDEASVPLEGSALRLVEISDSVGQAAQPPEERMHDSLTGVLSREAFADELDLAFANAETKPFTLLFIDLDDFKQINDQFGHLVGDDCLRVAGQRLSSVIRGGDAVGRFGGDEFLILLRGVAVAPLLGPIETRLRSTLCEPIEGPEGRLQVGVSLGAAYSRDGYGSPAEMVAAADRAMYQDKRSNQAATS